MRLPGPCAWLGRRISGTAVTHCVIWRRPASPARRIPERDYTSRARSVTGAVRRRGRSTTDRLELALAALWLLDGGLQLQPAMFTRRFATDVILPAGSGQPQSSPDQSTSQGSSSWWHRLRSTRCSL